MTDDVDKLLALIRAKRIRTRPVLVPVLQPPRHEHPPIVPGQEYPRDISPIVDRTVTEVRFVPDLPPPPTEGKDT